MARSKKLERMEAPEGSQFATLSREKLLLHDDKRGAADELYRRAVNKTVRKSEH